jgi:hypothetical protein
MERASINLVEKLMTVDPEEKKKKDKSPSRSDRKHKK